MMHTREHRLDIERLAKIADRYEQLEAEYQRTKENLKLAVSGLKTISVWAQFHESHESIEQRAMDTLNLIK